MNTRRWAASAACVLLGACGARTGLEVELFPQVFGWPDTPLEDADAGEEAGHDADAEAEADAPHDADAEPEAEAAADAPFDVTKFDCAEAGTTYIYVVTEQNELLAFMPPTLSFNLIGTLNCPVTPLDGGGLPTPFSMGVDRHGIAYVVFNDGNLFRVSAANAACQATSFVPGQQGFLTFGMGFSTDKGGPAETLFIASDVMSAGVVPSLGTIDTKTLKVSLVNALPFQANAMELTGTGDGKLFGFYQQTSAAKPAHVARIDKTTAGFLSDVPLPGVSLGNAWAFATWGGDFYFFTAPMVDDASPATMSQVTRYKPSDGSITVVATYPGLIVGAGVSTCAPEQ